MWVLIITVLSTVGFGVLLTAIAASQWDHRSLAEISGFDPLLYSYAGSLSVLRPSDDSFLVPRC